MRSTNARTLKGGETIVATARSRNVPNRPRASTMPIAHWPSAAKGTSGAASGASAMHGVAIDPQRPQGEVLGVEVVLEHEHAREPRAVPERVLPRAVRLLRPQEIGDPALDGRRPCHPGGQQRQQGPRGLRGRRHARAGQLGTVVAVARLAPAAVAVLMLLEPADRTLHVLLTHVLADEAQTAQHRPDRKSTRLNSSHVRISYAVFCLKKKQQHHTAFHFQKKKKKK